MAVAYEPAGGAVIPVEISPPGSDPEGCAAVFEEGPDVMTAHRARVRRIMLVVNELPCCRVKLVKAASACTHP